MNANSPSEPELRITTNRGGDRVFRDLRQLREFAVETSKDIANLTVILQESESDDGYISKILGLLNDLSFQLQQTVELICEAEVRRA